ncbi:P-loop containing nucleoside triphosphate hydrolase protein [Pelagophyceae sp. CCMP2097]|nr:P-loop containing nucleoside triphosphate hydrolase protein [Pelagophyceae sp. CCMP2097]
MFWRRLLRASSHGRGRRGYASSLDAVASLEELSRIPATNYITFSIIAHIDHGKSSLSQVLLERSGNIPTQGKDGDPRTVTQDALDTLEVEKQRGITVKAVTATMLYKSDDGQRWMINLIDTPGHADFAHEVRRSLTACDGALLLVDSSQGVEAQTLAVAEAAQKHNVLLAAACSKIDLPHAEPDDVALAIAGFGLVEDPEAVLQISAKTGKGVGQVLPLIVNNFAAARRLKVADGDAIRLLPLRARVLDSKYDKTRGVISTIQVVEGEIREQQRITMMGSKEVGSMGVQELGLLGPAPIRTKALTAGCVGYMICGLREVRHAVVGDTICDMTFLDTTEPLEIGFRPSQPALFASIFPPDGCSFDDMLKAVERLALNDPSVTVRREPPRAALGMGLRLGFLGLLHLDVFRQRLRDEYEEEVLFTAPLVPYRLERKAGFATKKINAGDGATEAATNVDKIELATLDDWPDPGEAHEFDVLEPVVELDVLVPAEHIGAAMEVLQAARGKQLGMDTMDEWRTRLKYEAPWSNVVDGLSESLAHATQGFASLAVSDVPVWRKADLCKVDLAVNGVVIDALSFVTTREKCESKGRVAALRLKEHCPRQQFEIAIQARIGIKVVARERIAPFRKETRARKETDNVAFETTPGDQRVVEAGGGDRGDRVLDVPIGSISGPYRTRYWGLPLSDRAETDRGRDGRALCGPFSASSKDPLGRILGQRPNGLGCLSPRLDATPRRPTRSIRVVRMRNNLK